MKRIDKIKFRIRNFVKKRLPYFIPFITLFFGTENETNLCSRGKNYIDPTKTSEEKIKLEKRRRNHVYSVLDYCLNSYTYYDYFTIDSVKVIKRAYLLAQVFNKEKVDTESLLLAFSQINGSVSIILEKYGLTKKDIHQFLSSIIAENPEQVEILKKRRRELFIRLWVHRISFLYPSAKKLAKKWIKLEENIKRPETSEEFDELLSKAAENALKKYKTPVISTEILFLTLMEEQHLKGGKLLKLFLESGNQGIWYFVRYDVLRSLYYDEIGIRTQIPPNEQFYAYLLKTQATELKFKKMLHYETLVSILSKFRCELINRVLKINLSKLIQNDVRRTMRINTRNTKRIYYDLEEKLKEKEE